MSPEMYQAAKELFSRAVEMPILEQEEFLRLECGEDTRLRSAVQQLLKSDLNAGDFLQAPLLPFGVTSSGDNSVQCTHECVACGRCFDGVERTCPIDGARLEFTMVGNSLVDRKYKLLRRIGKGGMGRVYRAHHLGLDRDVAIKLISPFLLEIRAFGELFLTEAKAVALLDHDNIVRVTDSGIDRREADIPYLVMDLLRGETLREYLDRKAPLAIEECLEILKAIASGLDYAHSRGVCHFDLTPNNVYLHERDPRVRIMDFGLARVVGIDSLGHSVSAVADHLQAGLHINGGSVSGETNSQASGKRCSYRAGQELAPGTPAYMAPECFYGPVHSSDPHMSKVDIYAFGVIAFELLSAEVPFGRDLEIRTSQLGGPVPALSERYGRTPPELDEPIQRLLACDPSARPPTASLGVALLRSAWQRAQQRVWRVTEIPRRIGLSLLFALLVVLFISLLTKSGLLDGIELKAATVLFAIEPKKAPDSSIVLVSFDNQVQMPGAPALSEREDEFIAYVEEIFAAGARAIAVDLILPERWGESESFSRLVLRYADRLTLALYSDPVSQTTEGQCLNPLTIAALGPTRYTRLFAFVNQTEDADGLVHRSPLFYRDTTGKLRDTWATRAARSLVNPALLDARNEELQRFWIDYSISSDSFSKVSWKEIPAKIRDDRALFKNRVVLLGAEYPGEDFRRVPTPFGPPRIVSGFVLQALTVNTIVNGTPITSLGLVGFALYSLALCFLLLVALMCVRGRYWIVVALAVAVISNFIVTWMVFEWAFTMMPFAESSAAIATAFCLGLCVRPRLPPFPPEIDILKVK